MNTVFRNNKRPKRRWPIVYQANKSFMGGIDPVSESAAAVVYETPAYANAGGTGDRQALITPTTNITYGESTVASLIDGDIAAGYWWNMGTQSAVGKYLRFVFPALNIISEVTYRIYAGSGYPSATGTYQVQRSLDGVTWDDAGSPVVLGETSGVGVYVFDLSNNLNPYSQIQLIGTDGVLSANNYHQEIEFKIGNPT